MDLYRSRKEKLDLLDEALNSFDGNVITAVSVGGSSGILGYARKFFFLRYFIHYFLPLHFQLHPFHHFSALVIIVVGYILVR